MAEYDGSIRILTEISTEMAKKSLGTLSYTIKKTAKEINSLRSKMDVLENQKIPTHEYKNLQSELAKAEENLAKLIAQQDEWEAIGVTSGGAWDTLNEEIVTASDNVDLIKEKMQALSDEGKDFVLGKDTAEYANYERQLKYEQAALERMMRQYQELEKLKDPYARLKQALDDLNKKLNSIRYPIEAIKNAFFTMVENIKARLAGLAASMINGLVHPFQTLKKVGGSAVKGVTKLFSGMATVVKKSGKAIASIASLLKRAASSMFGFGKSTKGTNNALKTGFKNILKYGLGIRSVYVLVNKLRTAIKEGFTNMSKEIEGFKSHVDSLKASTLTLKNSFAAAFRPLVETAIPYIQMVVDNMSRLLDTVGQFMAAIMGQKTYTKAIKQTTAAIEDENKAQNKQLSGLDKLNNLSSGSSAGDSGNGGIKMFEENVPVSNRFADIAQQFKDMWATADFSELGVILGIKLKTALENIPWDSIKQTIANIGKSFATLINGLVEVPGLAINIGKTIGEIINTGVSGINQFLDNTKWSEVGVFIGEGANSVVNTVDWQGIGHFFAAKLNAIFETIGEAARAFDWATFGLELSNGFNTFISDFNWEENGARLGDLVKGILDTIITFLENTNWQELGEKIAVFLANMDWPGIVERIAEAFGAALGALGGLLFGAIHDAVNSIVAHFLGYIFESMEGLDKDANLFEIGWAIIQGMFNGIIDTIKGIGTWIKEHIFLPIWNGIKSAFGIHSPSTVMAEIGKFLMEGLFNGISALINKVISAFTKIKAKIIGVWNTIKSKTVEIWNGIKNAIKKPINGILDFIEFLVNGAIDGINGIIEKLESLATIRNPFTGEVIWGLDLPEIPPVSIPRLATGAVLPANKEFLAVLGDQKHGRNLEAPEDLIRKIVREESGKGAGGEITIKVPVEIDGNVLFELIKKLDMQQFNRTGRPSFQI